MYDLWIDGKKQTVEDWEKNGRDHSKLICDECGWKMHVVRPGNGNFFRHNPSTTPRDCTGASKESQWHFNLKDYHKNVLGFELEFRDEPFRYDAVSAELLNLNSPTSIREFVNTTSKAYFNKSDILSQRYNGLVCWIFNAEKLSTHYWEPTHQNPFGKTGRKGLLKPNVQDYVEHFHNNKQECFALFNEKIYRYWGKNTWYEIRRNSIKYNISHLVGWQSGQPTRWKVSHNTKDTVKKSKRTNICVRKEKADVVFELLSVKNSVNSQELLDQIPLGKKISMLKTLRK